MRHLLFTTLAVATVMTSIAPAFAKVAHGTSYFRHANCSTAHRHFADCVIGQSQNGR